MPDKIYPIILSHSINNVFDACPRKFEFLSMFDYRPARDSSYAADVGTALHDGTQMYLIRIAEGDDRETAEAQGMIAFMKSFPWMLEAEQVQSTRSFANSVDLLYAMMRHSFWDQWELMRIEGRGWAVEVPFLIRHTKNPGVIWSKYMQRHYSFVTQGKIDLIMRHKQTGVIRTIDIKTTVIPEKNQEAEYRFSGQQLGYSHVLHSLLGITPKNFQVAYFIAMFNSEAAKCKPLILEKPEAIIEDYWKGMLQRMHRIAGYVEDSWFPRRNGGCVTWATPCNCLVVCGARRRDRIEHWFKGIDKEKIRTYDYWVELEA